jgi:hypothetical protein
MIYGVFQPPANSAVKRWKKEMFSLTIMRILVLGRLAESVNIVRIVAEKQPNENGKTTR